MLQWMIDECPPEQRTVDEMIVRILRLNFAAIHTTSIVSQHLPRTQVVNLLSYQSFTHALYQIAAEPQKIQEPLRQEAIEVIAREGFTKAAVEKLVLLDSVLREVMRYYGLSSSQSQLSESRNLLNDISAGMSRKAMTDYTFSDGTFIPKGTIVAIPSRAMHFDSEYYENPEEFQAFRYVPKSYNGGGSADIELPQRMVSTSLEYTPFGHGRVSTSPESIVDLIAFAARLPRSFLGHQRDQGHDGLPFAQLRH